MPTKPEATSTPNQVPHVKGRGPIRLQDRDSTQSPITCNSSHPYETRSRSRSYERSPQNKKNALVSTEKLSNSSSEENAGDSDYNEVERSPRSLKYRGNKSPSYFQHDNPTKDSKYNRDNHNNYNEDESFISNALSGGLTLILLAGGFLILCIFLYNTPENDYLLDLKLHDMCNSSQKVLKSDRDADFCTRIKLNLHDITDFDRTKTIIFLYEREASEQVQKIVQEVGKFAVCHLSDCTNKPVIIEGYLLSHPKYVNDYGMFITDYSETLNQNKVMILKHLEALPGTSAQVLHSICDEFTPVVSKALIVLTMEVNKIPDEKETEFVRNILSNLWSDIKRDDKFDPLFSRISETILTVSPM